MSTETATEAESATSWWSRPSGGREVLQVALPMVISTMSWTVMTYVDRALLARYSPTAMAAAFTGGVVWFAIFCLFLGVCTYVNTFVSQYHGDDQPEKIGPAVWQGNWLALASFPLTLIGIPLAPWIFSFAGHTPEVTDQEITYFQVLCIGGPGMALATSFSCFYSGRGITWVTMVVDIFATLVNIVLDLVLISGRWGFPEMGIAGAAWGTNIALWMKPFIYLALMNLPRNRERFAVRNWRIDSDLLRRLVYYGGPGGAQMLLDVAGFTVFVILVGRLGDLAAQASSLAFSINSVSFMPVWGLGIAAGILVGQHLGENRSDLAERATWTTYQISMVYMAILTVVYVLLPEFLLVSFFKDFAELTPEELQLRQTAIYLLYFVAAYNAFDTTQIIFVSALKGSGDTRFIMFVSLVMASCLAVLSYIAVELLHLGLYACWTLITLWLTAMAIVYFARFLTGKWKSMRVIEMVHHAGPLDDELIVLPPPAISLPAAEEAVS